MNSDLRRFARFEVLDYAKVFLNTSDEPLSAVVVDVGLGGIQIRTREKMTDGTNCTLLIGNEDGNPLKIEAEIRSVRKIDDSELYGAGCRFLPEGHDQRIAIAEYVHMVFQRQGEKLVS
jgi:hypothetical protein